MASYNGIFERSALGQTNTVPRTGTLDTSPDIIPFGIGCVSDPGTFFSDDYEKDPSVPLEANQTNYIYLRGKNYSGNIIDDSGEQRPRLFWTKASLLLFPQAWNELTQSPSGQAFSLTADAAATGVVSEPFIWQPDNIENDHYCLIAQVPSPGYDNAIPGFNGIDQFNAWVAGHGGIAWRSAAVNNSTSLTFTGQGMGYQQGPDAFMIEFVLICKNLPVETKVSFSAGAPGPEPAIFLPPTAVNGPDFFTGLESMVPANYVSAIYYNITFPKGTTPPPDAQVSLQAWYRSGSENGIEKVIVLGSNTLHFR